jgi:imidazolonepropionase
MPDFAIVNASQVVTVAGPPRPRTGDELREFIDAGSRIVLPGFVDAHTHPVFAGNRAGEFEQRAGGVTYKEIAAGVLARPSHA